VKTASKWRGENNGVMKPSSEEEHRKYREIGNNQMSEGRIEENKSGENNNGVMA